MSKWKAWCEKCLSKSIYLNSQLYPASNLSLQPNFSLYGVTNSFVLLSLLCLWLCQHSNPFCKSVYDCKDLPYVQAAWPFQGHLTSSPNIVIVWMHGIKYCHFCEALNFAFTICWNLNSHRFWWKFTISQGGSRSQCFRRVIPRNQNFPQSSNTTQARQGSVNFFAGTGWETCSCLIVNSWTGFHQQLFFWQINAQVTINARLKLWLCHVSHP